MNLQNGYKVIYEKAANGSRAFYASKTGLFADAETILEAPIGEYKLIYEKDGKFFGSTSGIPAEGDHHFVELDKVFVVASAANTEEEPKTEEESTTVEEPEVTEEPEKTEEPEVINTEDESGEIED